MPWIAADAEALCALEALPSVSPHPARPNPEFLARARSLSRAAGVLLALLGALVLLGWRLDVPILMGPGPGITMKANTAIAFILAGASLLLVEPGRRWPAFARTGQMLALGAGAIGAATLSQHLFGWNLGIDELLFTEAPGAAATMSPGRMGPPAALSFLLAGSSLLLVHARRSDGLVQLASAAIGLIALLGITGYAYGVEPLYGVARITGIALHTAVALGVMSLGLLAASAERGTAAVLVGEGMGSMMARRLVIVAIGVPLLLGWLRVQLEAAGHFDAPFGIALLVLALIVVLVTFVARTAVLLNRVERKQFAAEAGVRDRLQEIETMMDVLPIGLFMARGRSGNVTVNRAARTALRLWSGQTELPLDALPGHLRVFAGGVELQWDELPIMRAALDGVTTQDAELDIVFDDGTVRHELVSALPLLDERGEPQGAIASMMDVTARRTAEREREALLAREEAARATAERANAAKDEFIATVSHELRTPLNAILGWASMLRDVNLLDEPAKLRAIETIHRNCKAQAQLIEDLLDVSRISAGNLRLDMEALDLAGVVKAAADVVRPAADAKDVPIRLKLPRAPCRVRADSTRLLQVTWNLLSNAIKFSPPGSPVEVHLEADASDAVLAFVDRGQGIAPEFLPRVFERYSKTEGGHDGRGGGVGLGLSIARDLVHMHGGTLEVASAGVGRGASFTVRLPLLEVARARQPAGASSAAR